MNLLEVENLHVRFVVQRSFWGRPTRHHAAVDGVSLQVREGECFGVVGESGSGKSTLAQALLGLVAVQDGRVTYRGRDLLTQSRTDPLRREVQVVFQDPKSSLDPLMPVWQLITQGLQIQGKSRASRMDAAAALLNDVGLPVDKLSARVHAFSGGQRQRIAIARALSTRPRLLILDEPTSALDVSVQAQILNLLLDLQQRLGLSYLFVSHDLAVIRHMCHRLAVMRQGRIVEAGDTEDVMSRPTHAYTQGLLAAMPSVGRID